MKEGRWNQLRVFCSDRGGDAVISSMFRPQLCFFAPPLLREHRVKELSCFLPQSLLLTLDIFKCPGSAHLRAVRVHAIIFKTLHGLSRGYVSLNFCYLMNLCAQLLTPLSPGSTSKVENFCLEGSMLRNNMRNLAWQRQLGLSYHIPELAFIIRPLPGVGFIPITSDR